ncbi:MAG TPA: hypothetical protein VFK84_18065 [Burkholderiales bacterium]|nr:hypothetical protein [Burkholderiales bacterium]
MLAETVVLRGALVRIRFSDVSDYRLSYGDAVVYEPGRRRVRGQSLPYRFRSVEQLRYDFEQDVASLG